MNGKRQPRKLHLARELLLLAGTAETLRLAAERNIVPSRSETLRDFAYSMASALLVLRDRLRLVESVVMGMQNPAIVLCGSNVADEFDEGPGVIAEWSPEEILERREAERRGIKNRLEWEQRDKRPKTFIHHKSPPDKRTN